MARDLKEMSNSVIQRLPRYLIYIRKLKKNSIRWISSAELASSLGLTPSTVRQDLSFLELSGISKKGYEISKMEQALSKMLGINHNQNVIIIGAGNLGKALALHKGFSAYKFTINALFDNNSEIIGQSIGKFIVQPLSQLEEYTKNHVISMGVIAVPQSAAQEVADRLVISGISGILNLTSANLILPPSISVVNTRISASLLEIACSMNLSKREGSGFDARDDGS